MNQLYFNEMSYLYTFIMDYLGGSYTSQVEAESKEHAMTLWIENLPTKEIDMFSKKDKERLIEAGFEEDEAVLLTGLQNVWCFGVRTKKGYASVNFVKTEKE